MAVEEWRPLGLVYTECLCCGSLGDAHRYDWYENPCQYDASSPVQRKLVVTVVCLSVTSSQYVVVYGSLYDVSVPMA